MVRKEAAKAAKDLKEKEKEVVKDQEKQKDPSYRFKKLTKSVQAAGLSLPFPERCIDSCFYAGNDRVEES